MFRDLVDDFDNYSHEPDIFLDVPFVPTDEKVVNAMLDLGGVSRNDVLYDLGAGDGRIVVAAARDRDARAVGVEIDPLRIADAMDYAAASQVEYLVDFIEEDIFTVDFSEATVVTLYLLDSINLQLRPRLLTELRPGTRIVSHAFNMGDWKADDWREFNGIKIYKWIVPAQVEGVWEWDGPNDLPYRVELEQKYQQVTGSAWLGDDAVQLEEVSLFGTRLTLQLRADDEATPTQVMLDFENPDEPAVIEL